MLGLVSMPVFASMPPPYAVVLIDYLDSRPLTDADIFPSLHPMVEFTANGPGVDAVVWPRSLSYRFVKIRFQNPMSTPHTATLTITGASFTTPLGVSNLTIPLPNNQLSFPAYGEAEKTLSIGGLPDYVAKGELAVNFTLIANTPGGTSLSGGFAVEAYLTEADSTGVQNPVWRNVLDHACAWAMGKQGAYDVAESCTLGLYHSGLFSYIGGASNYFKADDESILIHYDLTQFFEDTYLGNWTNGDCKDVSGYLHITLLALGVENETVQEWPSPEVGIRTNPIAPIGSDSADPSSYNLTFWNFHQICVFDFSVFDACLALMYDPGGNVYMEPPLLWTVNSWWQWPNWGYPGNGRPQFYGLVDGYIGAPSGLVNRTGTSVEIVEVR